jgi:Spy/CpxP family protein refolding chaperone
MKTKILMLSVLFTIFSIQVFAQNTKSNKSAEEKANQQSNHLTKRLKLDANQQKQVYDISLALHQQIDQERASKDKGRHAKILQMRADADTKIEAVLNPEQKTKFQEMRAKQKEKMKGRVIDRKNQKGKSTEEEDLD